MTTSSPGRWETMHSRAHGWALERVQGPLDRLHGDRKRRLFGDLDGIVVEIGAGTGANFSHYPDGCTVIALEPNPEIRTRLESAADSATQDVTIAADPAERIDLPDDSADAVVSSLVLCSVRDLDRSLAEIRRILKPGGTFSFIEHVAAAPSTRLRRFQNVVNRPHRWVLQGCTTNRETEASMRLAGFDITEIERFEAPTPLLQTRPHIAGRAVKPS